MTAMGFVKTCASLLGIGLIFGGALATEASDEDRYLAEISTAMGKMMSEMSGNPSGDVDRDFVDSMIPHHQGAVDMAMSELRYGKNEQLRRIAQEIIVEQREEINAMRHALGTSSPVPRDPLSLDGGSARIPLSGAPE